METLLKDIRYGIRILWKSPGFAIVAVLTLALGIGANTAIFSVVNAVLLRPLPYQDPERLVQIWHVPPPDHFPGMTRFTVSPANYLDWANQNHGFEQLAIYSFTSFRMTGNGDPEGLLAVRASQDFFPVLKIQPLLGRTFLPEENQSGRGRVAVLSQSFWQTRFASDPNIVGRTIFLDGEGYTIVGVTPAKSTFPTSSDPKFQVKVWVPLAWTDADRAIRGIHNYFVIGRLKSGTQLSQAQVEMNTICARLEQLYPADDKGWGAKVVPLREQLVGEVRTPLMILLGAVGFVLLIACANVANLVLVKTLARQKEIAIRTALGASSLRLLRQVLAETVLLSLSGGILGLLFAHYGVRLIVAFLAQRLPRATDIGVDSSVLAFTLGISLLTGILAGLMPAFHASRTNLSDSLKQGLGRTDADSGGKRTRSILVISEVALSLVLLIGAGLMIRSLSRLRSVDPGMDTHNVLTFSVSLPQSKYSSPGKISSFYDRLMERVRALPAIESAGAIDVLPISNGGSVQPIAIEGRPVIPMSEQPEVAVRSVDPEFFQTMRVPLLQGRQFTSADIQGKPAVIVISDSLAKRFWPGENPIGKHVRMTFFPEELRQIVGVVGDVKQDGLSVIEPAATLYLPSAQVPQMSMTVVVRTPLQATSMASALANAVHELDRELPVADVVPMDAIVANSMSQQRFNMLLLGAFAGLALLLASIGIYSVISYSVRRRVQEIGLRMAMGAQRPDVIGLVLGQGVRLASIGVATGIIAAFLLTRLMANQLFQISATDPLTFLVVTLVLMSVAVAACYIPARRAAKVDPMVALRYE
jgi:predicted permease